MSMVEQGDSPAAKGQNCSFCDKSMKLGQITKFTKGIILGYGATRNKHPEQSTAHALKWPCMETRLDIINDLNG